MTDANLEVCLDTANIHSTSIDKNDDPESHSEADTRTKGNEVEAFC